MITDQHAIDISNWHIRAGAENLLSQYYGCRRLSEDWGNTSADQDALDGMHEQFTRITTDIMRRQRRIIAHNWSWESEPQDPIPNTPEVIDDGAPAGGRTQITGEDAHFVRSQWIQWLSFTDGIAWIDSSPSVGVGGNPLFEFNRCSTDAILPIALADATACIARCDEVKTQYEFNNNEIRDRLEQIGMSYERYGF